MQLRLVTLRLAAGRRNDALELLQSILANRYAESKYRDRARALLERVQSSGSVSAGRIGVLVPLSGEQEALGRAIADARIPRRASGRGAPTTNGRLLPR